MSDQFCFAPYYFTKQEIDLLGKNVFANRQNKIE